MRNDIQSLLEEITNIETGPEVSDDVLEGYITYFSFSLNEQQINSDTDNNFTNRVNIVGYVKRLVKTDENTLQIVDNAVEDIISKLKELNIRCSYQDVSALDSVLKVRITGVGTYNQINNRLV